MGIEKEKSLQKRDSRRSGSSRRQEWLGFVEVELTDEDKALLGNQNYSPESAFEFIEGMLEDGYKVSFSEDPAHSCFLASATGQRTGNPNQGYTLTGRGPELLDAVVCLAYKHQSLCKQGVWTNYIGSTTASRWG